MQRRLSLRRSAVRGDAERGLRLDPPLHLLLGSDALRRARAKLAAVESEIAIWEDLTISTDFPEA